MRPAKSPFGPWCDRSSDAPTLVELERQLDIARLELSHVEHGEDEGPALDGYITALEARNAARSQGDPACPS